MATPYRPSQDLEELVRQFRKYRRILGTVLIVVIALSLLKTTFYSIEADSEGVVLRFGKHADTAPPGLHLKWPWPIDTVHEVPVTAIRTIEFGFATAASGRVTRYVPATEEQRTIARMLTGDLNLSHVEWILQYRIKDPFRYLFRVGGHPVTQVAVEDLIRDVSEAVMRRLVGDVSVDEVITTGRDQIAVDAKALTQELLDEYDSGIEVVTVKLQSVTPPEPVKDAFDNVNRARQQKERTINQARGERNRQVPAARGKRDRMIAEAEGYREKTVRATQGQANAFLAKLAEYEKAPEITRMRMYLEVMEDVIAKIEDLIIVDDSLRGVLPLLSLDAAPGVPAPRKGGAR